ncbi:MAG TPA: hypothetical protein VM223_21830 [Planctomycetota bacterium]|nr:hypothetical protein [Planctomycetota bacterium]
MVTINWSAFLPDLALMVSAFAAGSVFGSWMAHRDYTRERELLRSLVPSPGLLRRAAAFVGGYGVMVRKQAGAENAAEMAQQLRALAARIEAAGEEWEE